MFACFSKKKKQKPVPPLQEKVNTQPTAQIESLQEPSTILSLLPQPKPIKKSKFCPIEPAENPKPPPEFRSGSLSAIDQMLEQELQDGSQAYIQQETGCFADLPGPEQTSRFRNILQPQPDPNDNGFKTFMFQDTKSQSFDVASFIQEDTDQHFIPKISCDEIHTIEELTQRSTNEKKIHRKRNSSKRDSVKLNRGVESQLPQQFDGYDARVEQWALDTTISLESLKINAQKIQQKIEEELDDNQLLGETLEEAENSFYCSGSLWEEFTRAIISADSPELPKRIFSKMNAQEKNAINSKNYTPIQLLVLKTISNESFLELAKSVIYDPQVSLECKGPTGWTPLQQALLYRNIPLVTHLFKASSSKKQLQFQAMLRKFSLMLEQLPDFQMEIQVKVDSFLPLVGSLAPNDTLKILKRKDKLQLKYSLVGYEFPSCKRRDMQILFDGMTLWGINHSKLTQCDLLQGLQHQEMILMIEDMLTGEMKRSWPIVHSININKALSLFQNEIKEEIAGTEACKHTLHLCYTSTAEKRRSQVKTNQELAFLNNYSAFKERRDSLTIKEKNKNKRIELQLWLAKDFGLQLGNLLEMLEILSMGNSFIAEWSKFFKNEVGALIQQSGLFPVKIDIPLNYSLFFNIEFKNFTSLSPSDQHTINVPQEVVRVSRKEFQGTLLSKEKRALFIQAYT